MEQIKQELLDREVQPTFQRIKIFQYLDENRIHPTVERIYKDIKEAIPTISRTTVYNTLDLFNDKGIVQELTISGTESRYDINTTTHNHFFCKECGEVFDIETEAYWKENNIDKVQGNRIEEIHFYFKGICKDCLEKSDQLSTTDQAV